jgi:hypothetical protein
VVNKAYSDASWADDSENVGGYILKLPTVLSSGGANSWPLLLPPLRNRR